MNEEIVETEVVLLDLSNLLGFGHIKFDNANTDVLLEQIDAVHNKIGEIIEPPAL